MIGRQWWDWIFCTDHQNLSLVSISHLDKRWFTSACKTSINGSKKEIYVTTKQFWNIKFTGGFVSRIRITIFIINFEKNYKILNSTVLLNVHVGEWIYRTVYISANVILTISIKTQTWITICQFKDAKSTTWENSNRSSRNPFKKSQLIPCGLANMANTSHYPKVQKTLHIDHNILEDCRRKLHTTDSHPQRNSEWGHLAASELNLQEWNWKHSYRTILPRRQNCVIP